MKFKVLILGCIVTTSAFATEFRIDNPVYPKTKIPFAYVAYNCTVTGEERLTTCPRGFELDPPREPEYYADYHLSEDGVCKALGFMKAKKNSAFSKEGTNGLRRLQVNQDGRIVGAVSGATLTGITCIDQNRKYVPEGLVKIDRPIHPLTQLPFSQPSAKNYAYEFGNPDLTASDIDAICRSMGYSRGVELSAQTGNGHRIYVEESATGIQVKADGSMAVVEKVRLAPAVMCIR